MNKYLLITLIGGNILIILTGIMIYYLNTFSTIIEYGEPLGIKETTSIDDGGVIHVGKFTLNKETETAKWEKGAIRGFEIEYGAGQNGTHKVTTYK